MAPMTIVDIHNRAARLLPKPIRPKFAKTTRTNHSHEKANNHLGRFQFLWQIWKLRQDSKL